MTDFIRRHKVLTILSAVFLLCLFVLIFAGRFIGNFAIEQMSEIKAKDKVVCSVNPDNATQIKYKDTVYQILNETVDNSEIGGWSGVCREIVLLDDRYHVLKQVKSEVDSASQVKKLEKQQPEGTRYVVTFFNVFTVRGIQDTDVIAVNLDSGTYKAVPVGTESAKDKPIQFESEF